MEYLVDDRVRKVTFCKRKGGLFKKADDLSKLCGVEVAVLINCDNKTCQYASTDMDRIITRFHSINSGQIAQQDTETNRLWERVEQQRREIEALQRQLQEARNGIIPEVPMIAPPPAPAPVAVTNGNMLSPRMAGMLPSPMGQVSPMRSSPMAGTMPMTLAPPNGTVPVARGPVGVPQIPCVAPGTTLPQGVTLLGGSAKLIDLSNPTLGISALAGSIATATTPSSHTATEEPSNGDVDEVEAPSAKRAKVEPAGDCGQDEATSHAMAGILSGIQVPEIKAVD